LVSLFEPEGDFVLIEGPDPTEFRSTRDISLRGEVGDCPAFEARQFGDEFDPNTRFHSRQFRLGVFESVWRRVAHDLSIPWSYPVTLGGLFHFTTRSVAARTMGSTVSEESHRSGEIFGILPKTRVSA
jgi:hypothetical protein